MGLFLSLFFSLFSSFSSLSLYDLIYAHSWPQENVRMLCCLWKIFPLFCATGRMAFQWISCADRLYGKLTLSFLRTKDCGGKKEGRKEIKSFDLIIKVINPEMGRRGVGNKKDCFPLWFFSTLASKITFILFLLFCILEKCTVLFGLNTG